MTCIHRYGIKQGIYTALKKYVLRLFTSPYPNPWQLLSFSLSPTFCLSQNAIALEPYRMEPSTLSLTTLRFKFRHVYSWLDSSFFPILINIPLSGWTSLSIRSPTDPPPLPTRPLSAHLPWHLCACVCSLQI